MRVLVTGAGGFIGLHVIQHLTKMGNEVIGLDTVEAPPVKSAFDVEDWAVCDITKKSDIDACEKLLNFDSVIHLAAIAAPNFAQANLSLIHI